MVKKGFAYGYLVLVLAFMYLPIILIIALSFAGNGYSFSLTGGFSLDSYKALLDARQTTRFISALENTVIIAVVSALLSTVIGTFSAIGIFHLKRRSRRIVENVNQLPVINSEIVMAVALMVFFASANFPEGYLQLIIAHVSFCTPYVILSITPRLYQIDPNIYEAALDLGATPMKALVKVQIPMLLPSIISGAIMAFTLSIDDFIITQMNKGTTTGIETISTYLYEDAKRKGLEPFWVSLFSILFMVIFVVLIAVNVRYAVKAKQNKLNSVKGDSK